MMEKQYSMMEKQHSMMEKQLHENDDMLTFTERFTNSHIHRYHH
jgi:hypothetical protein